MKKWNTARNPSRVVQTLLHAADAFFLRVSARRGGSDIWKNPSENKMQETFPSKECTPADIENLQEYFDEIDGLAEKIDAKENR